MSFEYLDSWNNMIKKIRIILYIRSKSDKQRSQSVVQDIHFKKKHSYLIGFSSLCVIDSR